MHEVIKNPLEIIKDELRGAASIFSNDSNPAQEAALKRIEVALRLMDKPEVRSIYDPDPLSVRIRIGVKTHRFLSHNAEEYFNKFLLRAELVLSAFKSRNTLTLAEMRHAMEVPSGRGISYELDVFRSIDLIKDNPRSARKGYKLGKFGKLMLESRAN